MTPTSVEEVPSARRQTKVLTTRMELEQKSATTEDAKPMAARRRRVLAPRGAGGTRASSMLFVANQG